MVSFDEQAILDNGAYIYNQRAEIERIADEICEKGFDSISSPRQVARLR